MSRQEHATLDTAMPIMCAGKNVLTQCQCQYGCMLQLSMGHGLGLSLQRQCLACRLCSQLIQLPPLACWHSPATSSPIVVHSLCCTLCRLAAQHSCGSHQQPQGPQPDWGPLLSRLGCCPRRRSGGCGRG